MNLLLSLFLLLSLQAEPAEPLPALEPATVTLNRLNPDAWFVFEVEAGTIWSFTAQATGTLDPVLYLYDEAGNLLLANDNEDVRSLDARLERWVAPSTGQYRLQVAREGGERAPTAGNVLVTRLPGYSVALSSSGEGIDLEADEAYNLLSNAEIENAVLRIEFTANFDGDNGFRLRLNEFLEMGFSGDEWDLRGQQTEFVTELATLPGKYALLLENDAVSLIRENDVPVVVETDVLAFLSQEPLRIDLVANEPLTLSNAVVTTTFYADDPSIVGAIPPVEDATQRIYGVAPLETIAELVDLALIPSDGQLIMGLESGLIETSMVGFSVYPLSMGSGIEDFVLGFDASLRLTGEGAACGMTFRQVDGANFGTALFSEDGNAYLLQYDDGTITEDSLAVPSPWVYRGQGARNRVLVIVQGGTAAFYINGRLVGDADVAQAEGVMEFNIVLREQTLTRCTLDNIWVWEIE